MFEMTKYFVPQFRMIYMLFSRSSLTKLPDVLSFIVNFYRKPEQNDIMHIKIQLFARQSTMSIIIAIALPLKYVGYVNLLSST